MKEMKTDTQFNREIAVFVTASSEEEAIRIGRALVEARLAACVNVLSRVKSIYRWEEKLTEDYEILMIVKTQSALFSDLAECVQRLHSYTVPEIIALPIIEGSEPYLNWIKENTHK